MCYVTLPLVTITVVPSNSLAVSSRAGSPITSHVTQSRRVSSEFPHVFRQNPANLQQKKQIHSFLVLPSSRGPGTRASNLLAIPNTPFTPNREETSIRGADLPSTPEEVAFDTARRKKIQVFLSVLFEMETKSQETVLDPTPLLYRRVRPAHMSDLRPLLHERCARRRGSAQIPLCSCSARLGVDQGRGQGKREARCY